MTKMKHTNILWAWLLWAVLVTRCGAFLRTPDIMERVSIDTEHAVDTPASHASPTAAFTDSPSTAPHAISAPPSFVSGVTNEPSEMGVVPHAPTRTEPWPLNSPTALAPIPTVGSDDAVDIPPSRTTRTPVHVFPTPPITVAPKTSPPSITRWLTNEPSAKTDSTPPPSPKFIVDALGRACKPLGKGAPQILDVRILSESHLDVSKADGAVKIELVVRDEKSTLIGAVVTVFTGKDLTEFVFFVPDEPCINEAIKPNTPSIVVCNIKLPKKKARPGIYKIQVCVGGQTGNFDLYQAERLDKKELAFSFTVDNTAFGKP
jgi:hypothetical protein